MIRIQYDRFMGQAFTITMQKLNNYQFPTKVAYTLKKFSDKIQQGRKEVQAAYQELIKPFAKRDEKGEIVRPEGHPEAFDIVEGKEEEYKAAEKAFGERFVELDLPKIPLSSLGSVQCSAAELAVLEDILDMEEAEAPVAPVVGSIGPKAGA